jgi:Zn-dependent protease with chaperone function
MTSIQGLFFSRNSSRKQTSTLVINNDGLVEVTDTEQLSLLTGVNQFNDLEISPRLGNTPRFIQFENGDRFETSDNDRVDKLLKQKQQNVLYRLLHTMESHLIFVILVTVFTSFAGWGFVKYGVPAGAYLIATLLPVETSQYLGQGTLEIMDESVFEPSELDSKRKNNLQALFQQYAEPYQQYSVKVLFRKSDGIGANAMALPDGHIIFTDDMVNLATQDEELIAIFGHEIGHLAHRHMLRRVIQDSMFTLVLVLITGDVSSASSVITAIPGVLLELAYSRKFEREADDFAYTFLLDNKIPTKFFADIMQRLEATHSRDKANGETEGKGAKQDHDYSSYLSTHPATEERIQRFLQSAQ